MKKPPSTPDRPKRDRLDGDDLLLPPPKIRCQGDCLFYGDSLTWGMAHDFTGRYDLTWPRRLEGRLWQAGLRVVEAALCSRTTVWDDPGNAEWCTGAEPHDFNGLHHFSAVFSSHSPKVLVLLLGTNDLRQSIRKQSKTRVSASSIASNCARIALKARTMQEGHCHASQGELKVVLVVPPIVRLNKLSREMGYDKRSVDISRGFPDAFAEVCEEHGLLLAHAPDIDMEASVDGVHVTEKANVQFAEAVWKVIRPELTPRTRSARRALAEMGRCAVSGAR